MIEPTESCLVRGCLGVEGSGSWSCDEEAEGTRKGTGGRREKGLGTSVRVGEGRGTSLGELKEACRFEWEERVEGREAGVAVRIHIHTQVR